jgi:LemA protein
MKKNGWIPAALLGGLIVISILGYISMRNSLIAMDEAVDGSWSQVQTVYQRRLDLIPNLVQTVKGYAAHENETFLAVTEARSKVSASINVPAEALQDPEFMRRLEQQQQTLSGALQRLMAISEAYPDLKANENFLNLQAQLEGTENRIAVERQRFNNFVRIYNTRIRQFPASFVAGQLGLQARAYFEAQAGAQEAPRVTF